MSKISIYEVAPVPKLADKLIGTSVGGEIEDITYNFTLGELLNLFIPNIPANNLQGVLNFGNTATQNINLTGTISTTNINVSGTASILNSNLTGETRVTGGLFDRTNSKGTAGQVLISTGTQVEWFTIPTVIPTLQQVLSSGNTADINIILTSNIQAVTVTGSSVVSNTNLSVLGTLRDKDASIGAAGQILSSTGTKVQWVNAPIYTATSPLSIDSGTRVISIQQAGSSQDGYLSSLDWISFNGKQNGISLTTIGASGPSTFIASVLNVPNYTLVGLGGVPLSRTLSINGVTYDLSADRSWTVDTLPAQLGNSGKYLTTDGTFASWGVINLSGYVPTSRTISTTGPLVGGGDLSADRVISIPAATGSVNGYLSFGDWNTFNNKQDALGFTAVPTSRTLTINGVAFDLSANRAWTLGTVTSVGLTMPTAFGVANSPVTSSGTLAVTALGSASQYIRGDGVLATLPTGGSGGSSVSYYLNGGTAASVGTYFQMSTNAVIGTNVDFAITGNGLISQFLTDAGDPNRLQIPAGNWNFEMFFSMSSVGGNTAFYVELLKYDGTTFTSIASSSVISEEITGGTNIDLYLTSLAIPATTLLVTDRLALRVYIVNNSGGRTVTLHTQDSHLCQIITNFAGGISALNGLTANTQYFATGTSGTDFGISSVSDTHTFNLPTASGTNRGALSSADWTTFSGKVSGSGVAGQVTYWSGTGSVTGSTGLVYNDSTGAMNLSKNQNARTNIEVNNTTSGITSNAALLLTSDVLAGQGSLNKYSNTTTSYKIAQASDFILFNSTKGDIAILNDFATGKIKFAAGGSSTAQMTLTAAGRLLLGTTTESTYLLDVNGTANIQSTLNVVSTIVAENSTITYGISAGATTTPLRIVRRSNWGTPSSIEIGALNTNISSFAVANLTVIGSLNSYNDAGHLILGFQNSLSVGTGRILGSNNTISTSGGLHLILGDSNSSTAYTNGQNPSIVIGSGNNTNGFFGGGLYGSGLRYYANRQIAFGGNSANVNFAVTDFFMGYGVRNENTTINSNNGHGPNVSFNPSWASNEADKNGGNITINGGRGTGTGTSGDVIIATATILGTGTTLQSLTSRWWVKGSTGTLTNVASPNASAILQADSTTQGFLPPRMTSTQRDAIATPAAGLQVYNTTGNTLDFYNGTSWSTVSSGNIYTVDGTLTGNRVVTMGANTLTFKETTSTLNSALVIANNGAESLNLINVGSTYAITAWRNQSVLASSKSLLFVTDTNSASGGSSTFKFSPGGYNVAEQLTIGNAFTTFTAPSNNYTLTINTGLTNTLSEIIFTSSTSVRNGAFFATAPSYSFGTLTGKEVALLGYGVVSLRTNDTGSIRFMTGNADPAFSTEKARITSAGRLLLGTTTESTFILDVNGTARVSENLLVSKNFNGETKLTISNTTSGNFSVSSINLTSSGGTGVIGKYSAGTSAYSIISPNDIYLYNGLGDISILNDSVTGKIKFAAGASVTAQMTLNTDGRLDIVGASRIGGVIITGAPTVPSGTGGALTEGYFAVGGYAFFQGYNYTTSAYLPVYIDGSFTYINPNSGGNVGINTTTNIPSAQLHINSTTKGFLPPRMTTTQKNAIASPASGLIVYDNTTNTPNYYNGTAWSALASGNIYTADGTLTGARALTHGGFNLSLVGSTHTNRFTSAGRLLLGTTLESTFILDVNGTARIGGTTSATNANNALFVTGGAEFLMTNVNQSFDFIFNSGTNANINITRLVNTASAVVGVGFNLLNSSSAKVEYASIYTGILTNTAGSHSGYITFNTTNAGTSLEKMRLTTAGRLLLGTTTEGLNILNVSGGVNFGTGFCWDNTNSRLGIGTATPLSQIDSFGGPGVTWMRMSQTSLFFYSFVNDNTTGSLSLISSTSLGTNLGFNQSRSGNVQIGTISDDGNKLFVNGNAKVSGNLVVTGSIGFTNYVFPAGNNVVAPSVMQWANAGGVSGVKLLNVGTATSVGFAYNGSSGPCYFFGRGGFSMFFGIGLDESNMNATNATYYIDGTNKLIINKQTSVNDANPSASAILNVSSTTQGFLPPRMTTTQKNAIATPAAGLIVYDNTTNVPNYYNGTAWVGLGTGGSATSGTYIPTVTNGTNITSTTPFDFRWYRIGDRVFVQGAVGINATTIGMSASLRISLPIASNFTAQYDDLSGSVVSAGAGTGVLAASVSNDDADITYSVLSAGITIINSINFSYIVK